MNHRNEGFGMRESNMLRCEVRDELKKKNASRAIRYLNRKRICEGYSRNALRKFKSNIIRSNSQIHNLSNSSLQVETVRVLKEVTQELKMPQNDTKVGTKALMPIREDEAKVCSHVKKPMKSMISSTTRNYHGYELKKTIDEMLPMYLKKNKELSNVLIFPFNFSQRYQLPLRTSVIKRNSIDIIKSKHIFLKSPRMSIPHNETCKQMKNVNSINISKKSDLSMKESIIKFSIIQSPKKDKEKKQFSTISLFKACARKNFNSNTLIEHNKQSMAKVKVATEVINEINEWEIDLDELRNLCKIKADESMMLVPKLRNIEEIYTQRMNVKSVMWTLFDPELCLAIV